MGPAKERFVLQTVLTDTLLQEMMMVLLVLVRSTSATANSLGSAGYITAAVGGSCWPRPCPMFQNFLFD